jgi:hypothetical protein
LTAPRWVTSSFKAWELAVVDEYVEASNLAQGC